MDGKGWALLRSDGARRSRSKSGSAVAASPKDQRQQNTHHREREARNVKHHCSELCQIAVAELQNHKDMQSGTEGRKQDE
jgi:hypothetical protein